VIYYLITGGIVYLAIAVILGAWVHSEAPFPTPQAGFLFGLLWPYFIVAYIFLVWITLVSAILNAMYAIPRFMRALFKYDDK